MAADTSGPAFPGEQGTAPDGSWNQTWCPGMTLRQWYAGMAMQGMLASRTEGRSWPASTHFLPKEDADYCFRIADAMLAHEANEVKP